MLNYTKTFFVYFNKHNQLTHSRQYWQSRVKKMIFHVRLQNYSGIQYHRIAQCGRPKTQKLTDMCTWAEPRVGRILPSDPPGRPLKQNPPSAVGKQTAPQWFLLSAENSCLHEGPASRGKSFKLSAVVTPKPYARESSARSAL